MIIILVLRPLLGHCCSPLLAAACCCCGAVAADALPSKWPSTRCHGDDALAAVGWAMVGVQHPGAAAAAAGPLLLAAVVIVAVVPSLWHSCCGRQRAAVTVAVSALPQRCAVARRRSSQLAGWLCVVDALLVAMCRAAYALLAVPVAVARLYYFLLPTYYLLLLTSYLLLPTFY